MTHIFKKKYLTKKKRIKLFYFKNHKKNYKKKYKPRCPLNKKKLSNFYLFTF